MMLVQDTDDCSHRLRVCFEISLHRFLREDNRYSTYLVRYYCFDLFCLVDGSYEREKKNVRDKIWKLSM